MESLSRRIELPKVLAIVEKQSFQHGDDFGEVIDSTAFGIKRKTK